MFRVRAVNAAGLSQFSPESEPVEVKAAIGERNRGFTCRVQEASGVRGHREVEYSVVGWKEEPAAKEMLLIMFENVLLVLYRAFLNSFSLVRHYF